MNASAPLREPDATALAAPDVPLELARENDSTTELESLDVFRREAASLQHLLVIVRAVTQTTGSLAERVGTTIERELAQSGALPKARWVPDTPSELLKDQLYRAGLIGFEGFSVFFQNLLDFAPHGVLSGEDSETLRWWMKTRNERRVCVALGPEVLALRGYGDPVNVSDWLPAGEEPHDACSKEEPDGAHVVEEPGAESTRRPVVTVESAEPEETDDGGANSDDAPNDSAIVASSWDDADAEPVDEDDYEIVELATEDDTEAERDEPALVHEATPYAFQATDDESIEESVQSDIVPPTDESRDTVESRTIETKPDEASATEPATVESEPRSLLRPSQIALFDAAMLDAEPEEEQAAPEAAERESVERAASSEQPIDECCAALLGTQGRLSWSKLEQLFVTAYCPLQTATLLHTSAAERTGSILERWSQDFENSYRSAFEHLRARGKRPPMVFDAPRIGYQLTRKYAAQSLRLVLLDGCRFDIAERAHDKLRTQLSGQAECVERGLLWAPLPATTGAALELLARGGDGLRTFSGGIVEDEILSRKESRKLRPLRAGAQPLLKLDVVQAALTDSIRFNHHALEALSADVAVSCGRFLRAQPEQTLVLLFGDHGFRLSDRRQGGASPEEVLVGYQAWLVS